MDIGPQKGPSSSAKIKAETAQVEAQLREIMEDRYYISINRDEKREFRYSEISRFSDGISERFPDFVKLVEKKFKENKDKNILIYDIPEESLILIIGRREEHIDCYVSGIYFEQNKYDIWDEMYDRWIELNV